MPGSLRSFLDVDHIPARIPAREPGAGLLADLRDGWREVASRPCLIVVVTAAVRCVPDVRDLRRLTGQVAQGAVNGSADAERPVRGLG